MIRPKNPVREKVKKVLPFLEMMTLQTNGLKNRNGSFCSAKIKWVNKKSVTISVKFGVQEGDTDDFIDEVTLNVALHVFDTGTPVQQALKLSF